MNTEAAGIAAIVAPPLACPYCRKEEGQEIPMGVSGRTCERHCKELQAQPTKQQEEAA